MPTVPRADDGFHRIGPDCEEEAVTDTRTRQVVVSGPGQVTLEEIPTPTPEEHEILVRTRVIGICGTDIHASSGDHPFIDLPYRPGHEAVGVIEQTGSTVDTVTVGDWVFIEPNLVCRDCAQCRSGRYNICTHLRVFGCQTAGAMSDLFTIPADRVHPVPDAVTDLGAVLVEPLATPVHAVRLAGDLTGKDVVVLGAGTIGMFTLLAARDAGAANVVSTDMRADQRRRALRLGAIEAVPGDADVHERVRAAFGGGADVVFDCVSTAGSIGQAIRSVDKGGTVVVVGVPHGPVTVPLELVQDREVVVRGCLMYVAEDVHRALELIAAGSVPVEEFISARYPLEQARDAFAAAIGGTQTKVVVTVP